MTDQEVFDKVSRHLLTQKVKSMKGMGCAYRAEDGTSCAIGCLIPDEQYSESFEGSSLDDDSGGMILHAAGLKWSQMGLASDLQYIHDKQEPSQWKMSLDETAKAYRLDSSILGSL